MVLLTTLYIWQLAPDGNMYVMGWGVTNGTDTGTKRRRGIIVVDSSTLYSMDALVPSHMQSVGTTEPVPRYVDLLRFLARSGYEIIIPEMVALECAQRLADGSSLHTVFSKSAGPKVCIDLIREATSGEVDNITIQRHNADSPASRICNAMNAAINDTNLSKRDRGNRVMGVLNKWKNTEQDLGESQAFEIINALDDQVPVFFLSDDAKAFHKRNSYVAWPETANWLNFKGLLSTLHEEHLLPRAGLRDTGALACDDHLQVMLDEKCNRDRDRVRLAANVPSVDREYHKNDKRPFRKSLSGLCQELESNPERPEAPPLSDYDKPSQVARFTKRFGKAKTDGLPPH